MSILKQEVDLSSDFPSFFSVIAYSSSVSFKLIYLIDFAVPGDSRIVEKEKDKIEKYQDLGR